MDSSAPRSRLAMVPLYSRALLAAVLVEIALRVLPLDRAASLTGIPLDTHDAPLPPFPPTLDSRTSDRLRAMNAVMMRWPGPNTCLRRALVLGRLLHPHHPRLVVGVAREDGSVVAHAWIETTIGSFGFDGASKRLTAPLRGHTPFVHPSPRSPAAPSRSPAAPSRSPAAPSRSPAAG